MFGCSVLLTSRFIWNTLKNLYGVCYNIANEFLQNIVHRLYQINQGKKAFANEHMTATKSKVRKSCPYGFL